MYGSRPPASRSIDTLPYSPSDWTCRRAASTLLRIGIQAVDQVGVAGAQGGGQLAVAAAEVDDQPALDARGLQDLPGGGADACRRPSRVHPRPRHAARPAAKRTAVIDLRIAMSDAPAA